MVENVIQIKSGITINLSVGVKIWEFLNHAHGVVKMINIWQVVLTIQWLSNMKL